MYRVLHETGNQEASLGKGDSILSSPEDISNFRVIQQKFSCHKPYSVSILAAQDSLKLASIVTGHTQCMRSGVHSRGVYNPVHVPDCQNK